MTEEQFHAIVDLLRLIEYNTSVLRLEAEKETAEEREDRLWQR